MENWSQLSHALHTFITRGQTFTAYNIVFIIDIFGEISLLAFTFAQGNFQTALSYCVITSGSQQAQAHRLQFIDLQRLFNQPQCTNSHTGIQNLSTAKCQTTI